MSGILTETRGRPQLGGEDDPTVRVTLKMPKSLRERVKAVDPRAKQAENFRAVIERGLADVDFVRKREHA